MAPLDSLVPKEEPAKEPSAEAQELEKLRKEKAEYEARLQADKDSNVNSRISELERSMQERYRAVREVPSAPAPEPAYQAQQELGLTDEEILAKPAEAVQRMAEHIANQRVAQMEGQVTQVLGHQVRRGFDAEIESLKKHPYFDDLAGALNTHFESNPHEMIQAGSAKRRFNELVGENLETLTKLAAEREAQRRIDEEKRVLADQPAAISRNRVVEPAIRPGTPPPVETTSKDKEFTLDENPARAAEKRYLMEEFNRHGANLNEEEWVGIEDGKLLPKKLAADIQMGRSKPNVEY